MVEPAGCFIDYLTVAEGAKQVELSMPGTKVRYRTRPPDSGCLHEHCDYPGERAVERGLGDTVEVVCFGCGMRWLVVPEPRAARKERG